MSELMYKVSVNVDGDVAKYTMPNLEASVYTVCSICHEMKNRENTNAGFWTADIIYLNKDKRWLSYVNANGEYLCKLQEKHGVFAKSLIASGDLTEPLDIYEKEKVLVFKERTISNKWEKEYTFLKGFAHGKEYNTLLLGMEIAQQYHKEQYRRGKLNGELVPYISHPVRVASQLIALGITDEHTLCTAILHDVVEDYDEQISALNDLIEKGIPTEIMSSVVLVTKQKKFAEINLQNHFDNMLNDEYATLVKISDRIHNTSTMVGAFSKEKIEEYVNETKKYILPLIKKARHKYPKYSNTLIAMKFQIDALLELAVATL